MDALFASPSCAIPLPIATLPAATGISGISQKGKLECQGDKGPAANPARRVYPVCAVARLCLLRLHGPDPSIDCFVVPDSARLVDMVELNSPTNGPLALPAANNTAAASHTVKLPFFSAQCLACHACQFPVIYSLSRRARPIWSHNVWHIECDNAFQAKLHQKQLVSQFSPPLP
ncbi:hypothetical protein BDP55DRAFT_625772 [Colletotrichum godetiae]|uniref:Uncharacterized protein n=1 Tax=Colletotrichum godetiae TaxID=1209918 RepID=A0AAJ0F0T8_9PEZI|nr:uncharacterized protein BDP55DRAFT_625772 [Colletotrichum godetiae]KAK1701565.1 hypothetical protein BDP55DRAFT_625772 [Colletotrichum godetiae]